MRVTKAHKTMFLVVSGSLDQPRVLAKIIMDDRGEQISTLEITAVGRPYRLDIKKMALHHAVHRMNNSAAVERLIPPSLVKTEFIEQNNEFLLDPARITSSGWDRLVEVDVDQCLSSLVIIQ